MNFLGNKVGGDAKNLANFDSRDALEIEQDDLPIHGLQAFEKKSHTCAYRGIVDAGLDVGVAGHILEFFECHQGDSAMASLPTDMGDRCVVGYAVDPGAQGALLPVSRQASPERQMYFLQQILPVRGIEFISRSQPDQRLAELARDLKVQLVSVHASDSRLAFRNLTAGEADK